MEEFSLYLLRVCFHFSAHFIDVTDYHKFIPSELSRLKSLRKKPINQNIAHVRCRNSSWENVINSIREARAIKRFIEIFAPAATQHGERDFAKSELESTLITCTLTLLVSDGNGQWRSNYLAKYKFDLRNKENFNISAFINLCLVSHYASDKWLNNIRFAPFSAWRFQQAFQLQLP